MSQTLEVVANGLPVAGTYAVNGAVVTFTPLTPLPGKHGGERYTWAAMAVQDLAGNGGSTTSHTTFFTTAATLDTTPPTIISVTPKRAERLEWGRPGRS